VHLFLLNAGSESGRVVSDVMFFKAPAISTSVPVIVNTTRAHEQINVPELSSPVVKLFANSNKVSAGDTVERIYRSHVLQTQQAFRDHPFHKINMTISLEDYMAYLAQQNNCASKPIFLTMARVSSQLYWQLIENFFYTMKYFGHLECAVMVCVSDPVCDLKCKNQDFPCYSFTYENPHAHTFEQVAAIKLRHVALALQKNVSIMLLDLDVGFLRDPLDLFEGFLEHSDVQVRTQMDIGWAMDKHQGMTWFTFPRANFGLFLVKGCPLSALLFHRAWNKYAKLPPEHKRTVAKDQSVIQGQLSFGKWRYDLNFSYFYPGFLPDTHPRQVIFTPTLLLHKVENYNGHGIRFELGGVAALEEIGTAVAVHATCYEKTSKLHALKAANAFWADEYYAPTKKTLTKPLMLRTSVQDLLDEVRALAYVALRTNRSLIIPNILLGTGLDLPGGKRSGHILFDYRANARNAKAMLSYPQKKSVLSSSHGLKNMPMSHAARYGNNLYWPAFRAIYSTLNMLEILEPGFYFKIEEQLYLDVPDPEIIQWTKPDPPPSMKNSDNSRANYLNSLVDTVSAVDSSRIVLDIVGQQDPVPGEGRPWDIYRWARHSTSSWGGAVVNKDGYVAMPPLPRRFQNLNDESTIPFYERVQTGILMCEKFLLPPNGNRSCFNKCN